MIGFGKRVSYAFRTFFSILAKGELADDVARDLTPPASVPAPPVEAKAPTPIQQPADSTDSTDRAIQILALLQRDGRLIDFFKEDISGYDDSQIGAAVRGLHEGCRQVFERYLKLEPVINSTEDSTVTVPADFDPAAIKLIGNVSGKPPFRGALRHRGWRAAQVTLPPMLNGAGRAIVAPAEVEIP